MILTVKYEYEIKTRNRRVYDRDLFDDSGTYILERNNFFCGKVFLESRTFSSEEDVIVRKKTG